MSPEMFMDTLLTAKSMYCQQHGINLTCVADGTLLNFLTTGEICTIVGTALDNATESVLTEQDPRKAADSRGRLRPERLCDAAV